MQLPDRPWNGLYALDAFCNIGGSGMGLYLAALPVPAAA